MVRLHAILSLSGAHIWLRCAPSARFQEQIPEADTVFSEEGTLAHDLGALVLRYWLNQLAPQDFGDQYRAKVVEVFDWYRANKPDEDPQLLTDMMVGYVEGYATFVYNIGGQIHIEEPLDLSRFIPLSWGTADAINIFEDILYVNDLKFGAGVRVSAIDNPQLKGYALGAYLRVAEMGFNPHTVIMNIIQPRMSSEPSTWQISVTELLEWAANDVAPQAALAIAGQGAFVPGEHCQFCKARTSCAAYFNMFSEAWGIHDARVITDQQRAFMLENGPLLVKFLNALKADAVKRLQLRERIPGFKLIATQGDRKFTDEVAVAQTLLSMGYDADQVYDPPKVKGITAVEKMLKPKLFKEALGPYVFRPEGNPKLVKEDHAAPAICDAAGDAYDKEDLTI